MNESKTTINEMNESKTSGKIKARVSRLWEVPNPYAKDQLICIDMVLIDEEGGYVHATIYGNSLIERFRSRLTEGDVYVLNHFAIESNKSPYRVVSDSKIMLKFQFSTRIKKIASGSSVIPRHGFDFVSFNTLEQRRLKPEVLTDVYGFLVSESVEKDSTAIEIRDKSENIIKLKLWKQFIVAYNKQMKGYRGQSHIIIVVTSTLVKGYNTASMKLDTSSSSKVYINLDFPEINELKSLLREKKEEIFLSTSSSQNSDILKKDISTIINHCKLPYEKNEICFCQATVKEVMGELPWYNPSCPDCNRKPKTVSKGFFYGYCTKPVEKPLTVYRLELLVEDASGITIFTMFNDEAKRMVGQDANTLFDSHPEQDPSSEDYDFIPSLLRNTFEDKTFVFKVKIDRFNHHNIKKNKQTFVVMKVIESISSEDSNTDKGAQKTTHKRQLEYISSDDEVSSTSTVTITRKKRKVQQVQDEKEG
ncbi:replication protein A 70 kDa DNA-binding subunit D-like [Silene latifolia]|uniref:replication protein A 70 kDa DNA-binding subunit D-like n=1 Tax=Silene latifolia TaxID=37657 RepID=UPI003D76AE37